MKVKRLVDIVLVLGGLSLLAPIILTVACLARRQFGDPILFRQARPPFPAPSIGGDARSAA